MSEQITEQIKFYNYHEYVTESSHGRRIKKVLLTDFPNPYVSENSEKFKKTRIVRVPRAYHHVSEDVDFDKSGAIPRFSEFFPGTEPGAMESIETDHLGSHVLSSKSNLRHFLDEQEYHELVSNMNRRVYDIYNPWRPYNVFYNICGLVTGWLSEFVLTPPDAAALARLEDYIREMNMKYYSRGIRLINPSGSGFVSVSLR
jgi:hypothetical protein